MQQPPKVYLKNATVTNSLCLAYGQSLPSQDIKLLLKLADNILKRPDDKKYHHIRRSILQKKSKNYESCLLLLHAIGFYSSSDNKSLIFDDNSTNLNKLESCHRSWTNKLKSSIEKHDNIFNAKTDTKADKPFLQRLIHNKIDAMYLLRDIHVNSNNISQCKLYTCASLYLIGNVLIRYKSYIQSIHNKQNKLCITQDVYNKSGNNYNSIDLLNNFNHLLHVHSNDFEYIYNHLNQMLYDNKGCKLRDCLLMKRHQRDRTTITKNETILHNMYYNNDDRTDQQLLDRVHCHFLHSFDIGCKLTQQEKQDILIEKHKSSDEYHSQISSKIFPKQKILENMDGYHHLKSKPSKFKLNMKSYNIGSRFYYWDKYKHSTSAYDPIHPMFIHWGDNPAPLALAYVEAKYRNIKEELLCNDICIIGRTQWKGLLTKAAKHYETQIAKNTYCHQSDPYYEMKYGDPISINHVIAMSVYCNYTLLSYKFSETYRIKMDRCFLQKMNDAFDQRVMSLAQYEHMHSECELFFQRHRNYYWLGRYMRECNDCFGMQFNINKSGGFNLNVYRGLNQKFAFSSPISIIQGPLSTTSSYTVAVSFCDNRGMILEIIVNTPRCRIDNKEPWTINGCDMQWISDYSHEQEIFLIGGLDRILLINIIEPNGINYGIYMRALMQIMFFFDRNLRAMSHYNRYVDKRFQPSTKNEKQALFTVFSHRMWKVHPQHQHAHQLNDCPVYFDNFLDSCFHNITHVSFVPINVGINLFLLRNDKWVDLRLLIQLFPNIKFFEYIADDKDINFLTNDLIYLSVLSFFEMNMIDWVSIEINPKYITELQTYLLKYKEKFSENGWVLRIQRTCDFVKDFIRWSSATDRDYRNAMKRLKISRRPLLKDYFNPQNGCIDKNTNIYMLRTQKFQAMKI
eukprot:135290_1